LPPSAKADEIPVLVVLNTDGREQLVNSRFINGWYEVDRLFDRAALILGVGSEQHKIIITNNSRYKPRSFWNVGATNHD
jgi:type IV secretion system protein VirB9